MRIADPFVHLKEDACHSYDDWCARIGETMTLSQLEAGGLVYLSRKELDDYEGVFKVEGGLRQLRLRLDGESIVGIPIDGGSSVLFSSDQIVLRCVPTDFVRKICEVNKFKLVSPIANQPNGVAFAERRIGTKLFKLVIALNSEWISSFGATEFVNRFATGCDSVALMTNDILDVFPWALDARAHRHVIRVPTKSEDYLISREWFTTPSIGVLTEQILELYPEKKIIFDERTGRIYFLGKEIVLKEGKPFQFLRGVCDLTSVMNDVDFAARYLEDFSFNAQQTFRTAKKGALDAIRKAFKDVSNFSQVEEMILPKSAKRKIKSGFQPHEILILSRPS